MGEVLFEGDSPFLLMPSWTSTAQISGTAVKMTVYVSLEGCSPDVCQIKIPMSSNDALALAGQLTACAIAAKGRQRHQ
jgi:hypothetical protein